MPRFIEFQSCCALMTWWGFACRSFRVPENLLFHIPNQSAGGPRHGRNLSRMGVRKGVPDYFLACARGKYHGLFVEMKRPDGKPTPEQTESMQQLSAQSYAVALCHNTEQARITIENYLKQ